MANLVQLLRKKTRLITHLYHSYSSTTPVSLGTKFIKEITSHSLTVSMVWYGMLEFNVPLDTV